MPSVVHIDAAGPRLILPAATVSLDERLRASRAKAPGRPEGMSMAERTAIAGQIAAALVWLHKQGVIHSSVRASCVVLTGADPNWKLSFAEHDAVGISEAHPDGDFLLRWCAPEIVGDSTAPHVPSCDVWSFGIFFWEVISLGATPYMNKELRGTLRRGNHPPAVPTAPRDLFRIVRQCCVTPASARPKMAEVQQMVQREAGSAATAPEVVNVDEYMPFIPSLRQPMQTNSFYVEPLNSSDGAYATTQETVMPANTWDATTYDVGRPQPRAAPRRAKARAPETTHHWDNATYDVGSVQPTSPAPRNAWDSTAYDIGRGGGNNAAVVPPDETYATVDQQDYDV